MRHFLAAFAALACATPLCAAPATVAMPTGGWESSSEGGLCRVQRAFAADGRAHLLILEQNAPDRAVGIALAGPSLASFRPETPLRVRFAADRAGFETRARIEPNSQFGQVVVIEGVWLGNTLPQRDGNRSHIDVALAEHVDRIAVAQGSGEVGFATGALGDAARALNACTAQIMRGWGLDPEVQYRLQRSAAPVDADRMMKRLRKAYARPALRALQQGIIDLVVFTDALGKARDCRLLVATGYEALDKAMCAAAMNEGFTPALGADGQATASFWRLRTRLRVAFSG